MVVGAVSGVSFFSWANVKRIASDLTSSGDWKVGGAAGCAESAGSPADKSMQRGTNITPDGSVNPFANPDTGAADGGIAESDGATTLPEVGPETEEPASQTLLSSTVNFDIVNGPRWQNRSVAFADILAPTTFDPSKYDRIFLQINSSDSACRPGLRNNASENAGSDMPVFIGGYSFKDWNGQASAVSLDHTQEATWPEGVPLVPTQCEKSFSVEIPKDYYSLGRPLHFSDLSIDLWVDTVSGEQQGQYSFELQIGLYGEK